jgi:hypothetical protein
MHDLALGDGKFIMAMARRMFRAVISLLLAIICLLTIEALLAKPAVWALSAFAYYPKLEVSGYALSASLFTLAHPSCEYWLEPSRSALTEDGGGVWSSFCLP